MNGKILNKQISLQNNSITLMPLQPEVSASEGSLICLLLPECQWR